MDFAEVAAEVRNWGRWGDDDEIGTLNLIDAAAITRGRDAIRRGDAFSLAVPLESDGMQIGFVPGRINTELDVFCVNEASLPDTPFRTSDDTVNTATQAATHWDGLAHVSYDGKLYNGYDADTITQAGAGRLGIHNVKTLVGRGVLLDVAKSKGVDMLDTPYAITGDDLDEAAEMANVTIEPGDIILIRTGRMALYNADGAMAYGLGQNQDASNAGPGIDAVRWFRRHDVAAVANDTLTFEVFPCEDIALAVHMLDIVEMGLTQGQNWDLEALAADCADDGVYEFFLSASPEPLVGACGSPVNPVAIK